MRLVTRHPLENLPKIVRSEENDRRLEAFLAMEVEDALTARRSLDRTYNEARRQYGGTPKRAMREVPVPNAPNIEITLGAILSDDIYAQATDTLFTASPLVTIRVVSGDKWVEHAKDLQDWTNWLVANELGLRAAANSTICDDTQLGTGAYYIPFVESTKKDRVFRVTYRSPMILSIAPEDVIIPPGSRGDHQRDRWIAVRFWYTKGELEERARERGWDISKAQPVAQFDLVRMQHEQQAKMRSGAMWREVYEVLEVYPYFDYDQDGLDEDLLVTFDRASRSVMHVSFNPYDLRPIEVMRYQLRSHLPYGLGVLEMTQPYQEAVTELHNYTLLNIFLACARIWAVHENAVPDTLQLTPGKMVKIQGTDDIRKSIMELKMSEVYPSAFQGQAALMQLAERRIGTSGAAGMLAKGGSRTPGVTALSLLQQVNRRFSPAFADMREKTGAAVRQAIYRYRERLKARDKQVRDHIVSVMEQERAERIIELLTVDDFDKAVAVEMTASTAQVNREADRQATLTEMQLIQPYYQQVAALAMQAAQQPMADELRDLMMDIARKGNEFTDRMLRTFENTRDPRTFLLDMQKVQAAMDAGAAEQQQAQQMAQQLAMMQMGQAQPGAEEQQQFEEPEETEVPDIFAPGVASAGQQ